MAFFSNAGVIKSRHEELFPSVGRSDNPLAVGACDAGSAVGKRLGCSCGNHVAPTWASTDILSAHKARDRDHVGAGFESDEARNVARVPDATGPRGDVQVLALSIERSAGKRHPVLPTIETTDAKIAQGVRA